MPASQRESRRGSRSRGVLPRRAAASVGEGAVMRVSSWKWRGTSVTRRLCRKRSKRHRLPAKHQSQIEILTRGGGGREGALHVGAVK